MKKKSLTYLLSHPVQYFSPLLKELAKTTDLKVYYFSDPAGKGKKDAGFGKNVQWDTPLLEGYDHTFLKNISGNGSLDNRFLDAVNPGVAGVLLRSKTPTVVVHGWSYCSTLLAIFIGRLSGKKIWLRSESPLNQELEKSRKLLLVKKLLLKHLLFGLFVDKCLYIGKESKAFFEYYGVKPSRLVYTPYAVDNDFFSEQYRLLRADLPAVKSRLGLPTDKKIILFSGKYMEKKRPLDLLKAFELLDNAGYALVLLGEGALRQEMEAFIREHGLQHVYLTGFVNQSAISAYYAVADVFVMCSGAGETWGLSVNEAMNFEKPVIVSATTGCSADLVEDGVNGFVFGTGDVPALADRLRKILEDDAFRVAAGKRSAEIIRDYSIRHIAENMINAIPDPQQ